MSHRHVAVWIDHQEAKIFHVDDESADVSLVHAPPRHVKRHPVATAEKSHPADAERFYHEVALGLEGALEILVVGPAAAKLEFIKHVHKHDHSLVPKIIGVETVDHPTDGQLLKHARAYFRAADRMR